MFTQLFGYYLLDKGVITPHQLELALAKKNSTKVRLGALAIDAGYMTAEQVDQVHDEQRRTDKRIGDIAVSFGFITDGQVNELLMKQKTANIVLGQTLIDEGYLTNAEFEDQLNEYKKATGFKEDGVNDQNLAENISDIYDLDRFSDYNFYTEYICLFVRNVIRFIGDDFAFSNVAVKKDIIGEYVTEQEITGDTKKIYTAIYGDEDAFLEFASRYAEEKLTVCDEYACSSVGEFLNLQNGLYAVNESNLNNVEFSIAPQTASKNKVFESDENNIIIPLSFSFGSIYVSLSSFPIKK